MKITVSKTPTVSVIVPIYKVENYLTQCIESIRSQTLKELEIILIDEGDADACRKIIDYYEKTDPRVIACHDRHGGYGASVNKGIELAKGTYLSIIESDDFIDPAMYSELVAYAQSLDAEVVQGPFYEWADGMPEVYRNGKEFLMPGADFIATHVPQNATYRLADFPAQLAWHPSIWTGLYKTAYVRKQRIRFDEKGPYLDHKFRFLMLRSAERIAWYHKPFYHWRLTNPSSTNAAWNTAAAIDRWTDLHHILHTDHELFDVVAPYMIKEEYANTFSRICLEKCSDEQIARMKENICDYTTEQIICSPVLNSREKKYLTDLQKGKIHPRKFYLMPRFKQFAYYVSDHSRRNRIFGVSILSYMLGICLNFHPLCMILAMSMTILYVLSAGIESLITEYKEKRSIFIHKKVFSSENASTKGKREK